MNNPKILDIDFDSIMKEFFIDHKNFDEKSWLDFWDGYKKSPIVEDIKVIIDLYKKHFRYACEFYLRYKDKPELLFEEKREYRVILAHLFGDDKDMNRYNEWLFKLAFKDVLEEEKIK